MRRIWEFLSSASQSRTTALLVILVIAASIPLTVLVAQRQQSLQQKADVIDVRNIISLDNTQLNQTFTDPIDGKTFKVTAQQKAALEAVQKSPGGTGIVGTPEYEAMRIAFDRGPVGDCIANCGGTTPAGGTTTTSTAVSTCNTPGTASCSAQGQICVCGSNLQLTCGTCTNNQVCVSSGGSAGCKPAGQGLNTTVDLKASPDGTIGNLQNGPITVAPGAKVYFSWNSVNSPDKCTASGAWTGEKASQGQEFITVSTNGTYIISCSKTTGGATTNSPADIVVVNVSAAAPPPASASTTSGACSQFSQYCNASGSCNWSSVVGTSSCTQTVTDYYRNCLKAPGDLGPIAQSFCSPSVASGTQSLGSTALTLRVGLNGIGATGDRVNPGASSASNKSPVKTTVQAFVHISDNKVDITSKIPVNLTYESSTGIYGGTASLPSSVTGTHDIRIEVPGRLIKKLGVTTGTPQTLSGNLFAGDIDGDNDIDIFDYKLLLSCSIYASLAQKVDCAGKSSEADLNLDGKVDQFDYNLLLREFGAQQGD
ncbi:MAG: hypothetical protein HYU48_02660 [Candidatus Levybacteria bacterium]|nr:hypothetical protein [Candidatus Levybacteria bacterium]